MFGDRVFGEPLRPRPRTFAGYSMRSYEGSFLGRGVDVPSRMFKSFRSPEERSPLPPPARMWAEGLQPPAEVEVAAGPTETTAAQPLQPQPAGLQPGESGPDNSRPDASGPEQPDIWFRSPPGTSDTGAAIDGVSSDSLGALTPPSTTGPGYVRPLSTQYAAGFSGSGTGPVGPRADLSARLTRSLADRVRAPISVSLQDGTAILQGKVAQSHDRTVAGLLILMEPGVRKVDNRLTAEAPDLLSARPNR
jgi:hypothetical protein